MTFSNEHLHTLFSVPDWWEEDKLGLLLLPHMNTQKQTQEWEIDLTILPVDREKTTIKYWPADYFHEMGKTWISNIRTSFIHLSNFGYEISISN